MKTQLINLPSINERKMYIEMLYSGKRKLYGRFNVPCQIHKYKKNRQYYFHKEERYYICPCCMRLKEGHSFSPHKDNYERYDSVNLQGICYDCKKDFYFVIDNYFHCLCDKCNFIILRGKEKKYKQNRYCLYCYDSLKKCPSCLKPFEGDLEYCCDICENDVCSECIKEDKELQIEYCQKDTCLKKHRKLQNELIRSMRKIHKYSYKPFFNFLSRYYC